MSFKKICFASLTFFWVSLNGFAQTSPQAKDSLMKLMSAQVCTEVSKIDPAKLNQESLEQALMLAMIPVVAEHQSALEQILDVKASEPQSFEKFGNELGMELLKSCPAFLQVAMNNSNDATSGGAQPATGQVSGKLLKVQTGAMNSFELLNDEGKLLTIWCTRHFEGDQKLADMNHIGKNIQVEYVTEKVYDFLTGSYREIFIARNLSGL